MSKKERPIIPGKVLTEQFLDPNGITQAVLAAHTGWSRKHVNQLCRGKTALTADGALILAKVFPETTPEYWLKLQRAVDLWDAMESEERRFKIEQARPLPMAS